MERVIKVANRLFKIQCIGKPIRSRPIKGWGYSGVGVSRFSIGYPVGISLRASFK